MKAKCDDCELLFDDWNLKYHEGFQLCKKCKIKWETGDQNGEVEPKEDYEPNPDFDQTMDEECGKCPD